MKISELKGKHDHALTSWLKVIIYSLLMIAPLFASISQWVYVSVNKNAKESYSDSTMLQQETQVSSPSSIIVGDNLHYVYQDNTVSTNQQSTLIGFKTLSFDPLEYGWNNNDWKQLQIIVNPTAKYIYLFDSLGNYQAKNIWGTDIQSFNLIVDSITNSNSLELNVLKVYKQTYIPQKLDNAFYYGVEKMTQSDLFNWTQNTTLYTGIKTMTDNLEIQTPAIAILLTYWFILTIIYVIIDIVLKGFTTLTHLIMGAKN